MASAIRLRVICYQPPPSTNTGVATLFGMQDKKRFLHPGTMIGNGQRLFEIDVLVKRATTGESWKFSGPFVHGQAGGEFLYLGWRPESGPDDSWIRRWKISLPDPGDENRTSPGSGFEIHLTEDMTNTVWLRGNGWTAVSAERQTTATAIANEES